MFDFYIFEKFSDLKTYLLWTYWIGLFFFFIYIVNNLLTFSNKMPLHPIFTMNDDGKERKNQIHKYNPLSITFILNKSNAIQTFHWSQLGQNLFLKKIKFISHSSDSHCIEQYLRFILIIGLSLSRFWVIKSQL